MKKLTKGIAVVTGIVGVAAIAVGVFEKVTGRNIVDEAKKFLDKIEEDDFADEFEDFDDSDYDEDDDIPEDSDDLTEFDDFEDDDTSEDSDDVDESEESEDTKDVDDEDEFEEE